MRCDSGPAKRTDGGAVPGFSQGAARYAAPSLARTLRARAAVGFLASFLTILPVGCRQEEPDATGLLRSRDVRVLLFDSKEGCRVRVDGRYVIRNAAGDVLDEGRRLGWTTVTAGDGLVVGELPAVEGPIVIEPKRSAAIFVSPRDEGTFGPALEYAGSLELNVTSDGSVRAVNVVDLESYVAGVVPNESPPSFHDESLAAQAIVARTYAMFIMADRTNKPFDLRASEGDQVYRGVRSDAFARRAAEAVKHTRGLVLAWDSPDGLRAFCTYYSSACGGHSQSLAEVQPGEVPTPLRGGVVCDYCKIAGENVYRWGPEEILLSDLLARLQARDESFASWQQIESVVVSRTTENGRIGEVVITGDGDHRATMIGERFRLAVGSRIMRSTDCTLVQTGDRLRFEDGHGFGHGVGLCQWGMEGQAREGATAARILRYYYPGAKLVRAY